MGLNGQDFRGTRAVRWKTRDIGILAVLMAAFAFLSGSPSAAQTNAKPIRIGVLTGMSGTYADLGGEGSVVAAQMAVDDFGKTVLGRPIEVVSADHQGKADVASTIARKWFDVDDVQLITDLVSTPTAIATQQVGTEKKRITINTSATTDTLTNKDCGPYAANWVFDSHSFGKALAVVAEPNSTWYFITIDHSGGVALQGVLTRFLSEKGAKVLGAARFPPGVGDMSSFLVQAQASKAKYIALIMGGHDLMTTLKQAREFGLAQQGQTPVGTLIFQSDLKAMGPEISNGLVFGTGFFSGASPEATAWSKRFYDLRKTVPNDTHAGVYSAVRHYLEAVRAAGTLDADAVMKKMREMPINDMFAKNGVLRKDGRMVHDFYVVKGKPAARSSGPLDTVDLVQTIPGSEAFGSLADSTCPFLK